MNRRPLMPHVICAASFSTVFCIAIPFASAVPYASGVRNTSGSNWEFVLNEDADQITISRTGGSDIVINNPTAGRHQFDLEAFSGFDIEVTKSAAPGLTQISDDDNLFNKYFRPAGLAINRDPSSEFFGTIYVANGIPATTGGANARATGDGIYAQTADQQGVDLSTPNWVVPDPQDTTQARIGPGWEVSSNNQGSGNNSPYRIALDDGGNVIVGDWSDANGGVKYLGPDLLGGGLVLAQQGHENVGGTFIPTGPFDGSTRIFTHGSIRGVPNVTGTVGVDLVIRAMDEDLTRDESVFFDGSPLPTDGNHVWRWNVGSQTNVDIVPDLLIDVGSDNAATPPVTGFPQQLGVDSAGRPFILDLNIGVRADAEFFPELGDEGLWILTQPRFNGDESGIVIVEVDESGATDPQVLWSSRQFTIDNNLDGFPNDPDDFGQDPNSDVFRNTGSVDVSPDGSTLYVHRWLTDNPDLVIDDVPTPDINPFLGRDSNLPGALLAIPLDENGLPDIQIDDNGTPGDTTDDFFTNLESLELPAQEAQNENHEIEVDAAGNIYITDNITELLSVFSPGGDSTTRFSFDGTNFSFEVVGPTVGIAGDYNGDGTVDAADYTVWRDSLGQMGAGLAADGNDDGEIDAIDYAVWRNNFGQTAAVAAGRAVPEPGSLLLVLLALAGLSRRHQ